MDGRTRYEMKEVIVLLIILTTGTYNSAELNVTQKNITIFILTTEILFVKTVSRKKWLKFISHFLTTLTILRVFGKCDPKIAINLSSFLRLL